MTYADQLMRNKYAMTALNVQQKQKLTTEQVHSLAHELCEFEESRLAVGKETSKDHLTQQAVKLSKEKQHGSR